MKNFKKSDLKSGMTVELRDGSKHLVMIGIQTDFEKNIISCLINLNIKYSWTTIESYGENLKHIGRGLRCGVDVSQDIIKVWSCNHPYIFVQSSYTPSDCYKGKLLWEYSELPEYVEITSSHCGSWCEHRIGEIVNVIEWADVVTKKVYVDAEGVDRCMFPGLSKEYYKVSTKEAFDAYRLSIKVPEYTMEEAIEKLGHEFKIKK